MITVSEGLFYGFYSVLTLAKWMGLYEGMLLYTIGVGTAFLFLLVKLVTDRYTMRRFGISVLALALGVATWRLSDKMGALFNIALVASMAGVNRERLLRITAGLWSILFALQVFLSLSGIRSTQIVRVHDKLGHYIVRWSMGFTHPNVLHITYYVLIAILMYVFRPQGKRLWRASILAMLGNVLIFLYSLSYTGLAITTFYIVLNLLLQYWGSRDRQAKDETSCSRTVDGAPTQVDGTNGRMEATQCGAVGDEPNQKVAASSDMEATADTQVSTSAHRGVMMLSATFTGLCIIFAVAGPLVLKGRVFDLVNRVLSTRLELSRQYLFGQRLSLFGTANMEVTDASITLDSSYVYMLMHYGIVYFVLFTVLLLMAVVWYARRRDYWGTAILMACALSGITEQYMANTSFKNIAVLLIGCMIWEYVDDERVAREWRLQIPVWCDSCKRRMMTGWRQVWSPVQIRRTLALLIAAFVIGTAAYAFLVHRPSAVYASLWDCDRPEGAAGDHYIYYDDLMADPEFDGWILSNRDAEGKLYEFHGFTADYEYDRRAAGMGIAAAMITCVATTAVMAYRRREENSADNATSA